MAYIASLKREALSMLILSDDAPPNYHVLINPGDSEFVERAIFMPLDNNTDSM